MSGNYEMLGENEILQKMSGKSQGNSTFQPDEARMFGPDIFFLLNS